MMCSADHPFAPEIERISWIDLNIQVIDHAAESHYEQKDNKSDIMDRDDQ